MMCMHVLVVLYSLYRFCVFKSRNMEFFRVSSSITSRKGANSCF